MYFSFKGDRAVAVSNECKINKQINIYVYIYRCGTLLQFAELL